MIRIATKNKIKSNKKIIGSLAIAAMLTTIGFFSPPVNAQDAAQVVFSNTTAFTVADRVSNNAGTDPGLASLYPSTISVTGLTGSVTKVKVSLNLTHTFPDDLDILLVGPTGAKTLLISDAGGSGNVTAATYTFDQAAANNFPDVGTDAAPVVPGSYKPANYTGLATPEPNGQDNFPTAGGLQAFPAPTLDVFNGTAPNGVWSLYVVDDQTGDTGSVPNGWSLDITTGTPTPTGCTTEPRPADFDGNGTTDLAVVRNTGGGNGGQITWYTKNPTSGTFTSTAFGISTDVFTPSDFDGDGKADIAVWRSGAQGYFYILQSGNNTLRTDTFGQTGDDPSVIGDYDGDNKVDPAVYRGGATAGSPSFWYYRSSISNGIVGTQWGQNGDFPTPGDFDGDGKNDFVIQRNGGGGSAQFYLNQTTAGFTSFLFGTPTDVIVPGYYDADCKTDIATIRGVSGNILWSVRNSATNTFTSLNFGASATDFPTQGDYDGDGRIDIAVWRPSASGGVFYWNKSTTNSLGAEAFGAQGDYPVANYNSH